MSTVCERLFWPHSSRPPRPCRKLALRKETPLHKNFSHISRRSHLFDVKLEANPDYDSFAGSATRIDTTFASRYICPITKRPANGVTPFVCFKPCGHAVSEQCVKHMKSSEGDTTCVICATPYNKVRCSILPRSLRVSRRVWPWCQFWLSLVYARHQFYGSILVFLSTHMEYPSGMSRVLAQRICPSNGLGVSVSSDRYARQ